MNSNIQSQQHQQLLIDEQDQKFMSELKIKISSSQDLRPENVPERQWRLLQIEAIRKELDLQVIKDAISLTELNQPVLFTSLQESVGRKNKEEGIVRLSQTLQPHLNQSQQQQQLSIIKEKEHITTLINDDEQDKNKLVLYPLPKFDRDTEFNLMKQQISQNRNDDKGNKKSNLQMSQMDQYRIQQASVYFPILYDKMSWKEKEFYVYETIRSLFKRSITIPTENEESGVLFTRQAFASCADELLQRMQGWAEEQHKQAVCTTHIVTNTLYSRLAEERRRVRILERERFGQRQAVQRRVQKEVTEKSYQNVYEVENLQNSITKLFRKRQMKEKQIMREVRSEYDYFVINMRDELQKVNENFNKYKAEMQNSTILSLLAMTNESLRKVDLSASNALLHSDAIRQAVGMIQQAQKTISAMDTNDSIIGNEIGGSNPFGNRDLIHEMHNMRQKNTDLETRLSIVETEAQMSENELHRQLYSQTAELDKILEKEREEHFELIQMRDVKVRMLEMDSYRANTKLSDAVAKLETVEKEQRFQNRNKMVLMKWKVNKTRLHQELQEQLDRVSRYTTVDVDKLYQDLEQKETELRVVEMKEKMFLEEKQQEDDYNKGELDKLKKMVNDEKKHKQEAFEKLTQIRVWLEQTPEETKVYKPEDNHTKTQYTTSDSEDSSDLELKQLETEVEYKQKLGQIQQSISSLAAENEKLRHQVEELAEKTQREGEKSNRSNQLPPIISNRK